jgi:hypothetical protein
LFEVDIFQIVVHEAGEPNAVVDLFDAEALAGRICMHRKKINISTVLAAGSDQDLPVMEGVGEVRQSVIGPV